jgi:electron transfer flavoprotein beta subunit
MKIGVLVKQVPDTATKIKIRDDRQSIDAGDIKWIINPYDEFAVEEALKLKTALNAGEVVVISLGPQRVQEAMRTALAMGADRGIHLSDEAFEGSDTLGIAKVLKAAITGEAFDLFFSGKTAIDDDNAQLPQALAELLGIPHVSPISSFQLGADKKSAIVQRTVGGGAKEVIEVSLPAIFGCDKGLNEPRYASLPGIMKAKSKPIKAVTLAETKLGKDEVGAGGAQVALQGLEYPPERKAGQVLKGDAAEASKKLIDLLRNEAKVV